MSTATAEALPSGYRGYEIGSRFDTTLSVRDRESQLGMKVVVTPLKPRRVKPPEAPCNQAPPPDVPPSQIAAPIGPAASHPAEANSNGVPRNEVVDDNSDELSSPSNEDTNKIHIAASTFGEGGLQVSGLWRPGPELHPLGALSLIVGDRGPCALVAAANVNDENLLALHNEMREKLATAVIELTLPNKSKREIHLYAVPQSIGKGPVFLGFETLSMAPWHCRHLLVNRQLVVVFDLDETLLQAFTITSLDRRMEILQRAHKTTSSEATALLTSEDGGRSGWGGGMSSTGVAAATGAVGAAALTAKLDAKETRQRREEDMHRLQVDRAMLFQFVQNDSVTLNGRLHVAKAEPAPTASGTRPVIRLPSPHCRGGSLIFTRIDPENRDTSMIVHIRPGWTEMRDYLTGKDRGGNPRCSAFVCTMSEHVYAQEMWRLLDPTGRLIPAAELRRRVVSVPPNSKKTMKVATGGVPLPRALCVVLDDRTSVWEEATQPHILAVAPFMPYATDTGPGLKGEVSGSGGVLGAAQGMMNTLRANFALQYERFEKYHAQWHAQYHLPDQRPQFPNLGALLVPLMAQLATKAAAMVAQQGGAARSASGTGSRLGALLSGMNHAKSNAPRPRPIPMPSSKSTAGGSGKTDEAGKPAGALRVTADNPEGEFSHEPTPRQQTPVAMLKDEAPQPTSAQDGGDTKMVDDPSHRTVAPQPTSAQNGGDTKMVNDPSHRTVAPQPRWSPTPAQLTRLEELFAKGFFLGGSGFKGEFRMRITEELAKLGPINEGNVDNWFKNKKARMKKQLQEEMAAQDGGDAKMVNDPSHRTVELGEDNDSVAKGNGAEGVEERAAERFIKHPISRMETADDVTAEHAAEHAAELEQNIKEQELRQQGSSAAEIPNNGDDIDLETLFRRKWGRPPKAGDQLGKRVPGRPPKDRSGEAPKEKKARGRPPKAGGEKEGSKGECATERFIKHLESRLEMADDATAEHLTAEEAAELKEIITDLSKEDVDQLKGRQIFGRKTQDRAPKACSVCRGKGLTPEDHFRYSKYCPFHPDFNSNRSAGKADADKQEDGDQLVKRGRGRPSKDRGREMTYAEKQELIALLGKLSDDEQAHVMEAAMAQCKVQADMGNDGSDPIQINFEELDSKMLWKLDHYARYREQETLVEVQRQQQGAERVLMQMKAHEGPPKDNEAKEGQNAVARHPENKEDGEGDVAGGSGAGTKERSKGHDAVDDGLGSDSSESDDDDQGKKEEDRGASGEETKTKTPPSNKRTRQEKEESEKESSRGSRLEAAGETVRSPKAKRPKPLGREGILKKLGMKKR